MAHKRKPKTDDDISSLKELPVMNQCQFESIINHINDSVLVVDSDGIIEFANKAAQQLFGSKDQSIIGKDFGYPILHYDIAELDIPQKGKVPRIVEMHSSETVWHNKNAWLITLRDITNRKHTLDALHKNQLHLKTLVQNISGVFYQHINYPDGSGKFLYISPQCKLLYELDQQAILEDERQLWKRHHPDEIVELVKTLREHAKTLTPLHWEGRIIVPSGKIKWVQVSAHVKKNANGDLIWDGLILDITSQKNTEAQLRKLSTAVEQSENIVILTDPNGVIEYVNRKFTEVTGFTFDDAVGQNPRFLKSGVHLPEFYKHLWDVTLSGKKWSGEFCDRKKNGELYWESATINAIKDENGKIVNLIAIKQDITEQKKTQALLHEHETLIQSVFKTLTTGICITDETGILLEANDAYCRLYGYSLEEVIGKPFTIVVPEKDRSFMQKLHDEFIEGKANLPGIAHVVRKDGKSLIIEFSSGLITHENGKRFKVTSVMDVTDRVNAESVIRQSEERYREIVETAFEGIWVIDKEGRINFVNSRMADMLGYKTKEIVDRYVKEFIDKRDIADFILYIDKHKNHIAEERDFRFLRKDGSTLWGLVSIRTKVDADGQFIGALGMVSDITERKQAEEDLKSSQQRLKRFFDQTFLAVIEGSYSFEIKDWNPAAEKIFGYKKEEVIGRYIKILVADDDWENVYERLRALIRTGQPQVGISHNITKDGRRIVCNWHNTPLTDDQGDIIGTACFAEDITERKKAEASLLQSQKSLAAILESIDAGVILIDKENNISMFNRAAEKIFEYSSSETIGKPVTCLIPETLADEYLTQLQRFRKSDKTSLQLADTAGFMGLKKSQLTFPIEISGSKIEVNHQEVITILVKDITERKIMQEQILRNQRMESIGLLASGIAHDMNNILTPLMLSLDMLKMYVISPKGIEYLDSLTEDAKRATDLVAQLLAFARGRGGKKVAVDLHRMIIDFERLLRETFPKSIQVKTVLPKDLPTILADQTQIHQVLMNLCVNAKDAMPEGGQILIKAEPFLVDEAYSKTNLASKAGLYVLVSVADTGTGIPSSLLNKIFEPFFTTKQNGKGTGLGLVTVYSIVQSHGGFINVSSTVGKGTTFEFYLPAIEDQSNIPLPTSLVTAQRGNGELVLIVDDELSIREITSNILTNYGYKAITACNGSEAVAVYAERKDEISIVVLDMMMPVMDGFSTIHALRNLNPNVKIIATSGLIDKETMQKSSTLKVDGILSKPYTSESFLSMIHNVLTKKPQ